MTTLDEMDARHHREVARDVGRIVTKTAKRIAREHGGCPISLVDGDAWLEVIADMSRRELLPEDYVEAVRAEEAT